ncbi:unnamed protein product, partial [Sphagnum jensenii]
MKVFAPSFGSWHGQFISKVVEAVSWMKDFFGCGSQSITMVFFSELLVQTSFSMTWMMLRNLHTFFCAFSQNSQKHLRL